MFEPSRSEILLRTQRLIRMGEWLERNAPIFGSLIEALSDAVELHLMDEDIDSWIEEEFHQLSRALSACIQNLSDYKASLTKEEQCSMVVVNYPRHPHDKQPTVVLDEQQSQESTKS
jgi:hypothetical protein